ncbi:uncharacterized protein CG13380 [Musca domestica]|uniref:Uncharacterized protein CG13380 n=1 Tax=Musca domestica TaxID=7370 RepID=A0A9J7D9Z6_MUSDO|nr:uncharacterized protein CG13380 [Musca domestica]
MRKSRKINKSVNSRMDYARENNQFAAFSPKDENNNEIQVYGPPARELRSANSQPAIMAELEERPTASDGCICNRKSQIIECKKCRMLCYGRVSETCPRHPNVSYLMDLYYCPSCYCSRVFLTAKK